MLMLQFVIVAISDSVISCVTILLIKIGNIHLYTYNKV